MYFYFTESKRSSIGCSLSKDFSILHHVSLIFIKNSRSKPWKLLGNGKDFQVTRFCPWSCWDTCSMATAFKKSVQSENQWQFFPFSSRSSSSPEGPWKPSFPLPLRWTWNFRKSQNFCSSSFQENLKVGSSQRRGNRLNYRQHSGKLRRKIREHVLLFTRSWGFQEHPTFAWCLGTAGLWPWDAPTIT